MAECLEEQVIDQLKDRRSKLEDALECTPGEPRLRQLLVEVDDAIARVDDGTYGLCQTCHDPIEPDRLLADPLVQFCLDHLTTAQQQALEKDLELASKIQTGLLPCPNVTQAGWEATYRYEGAGPVSGDYCDILEFGGDLYFTVGDVTGKGIAASMLMAHLHASFRTLVSLSLPLDQVVQRASRMLCESTLPTHFATLVIGKACSTGEVEICNAGHNPPLVARGSEIEEIRSTGLPLGIFCEEQFSVHEARMNAGDTILLYTDGLSEARNSDGTEYGADRLTAVLAKHHASTPEQIITASMEDLKSFQSGTPRTDDLTVMAIRRTET